jgi:hypothetical protein
MENAISKKFGHPALVIVAGLIPGIASLIF